MNQRPTTDQRGYTRRWKNYRDRFLQAHPLCAMHLKQGRPVAATVVDHVKPHRLGEAIESGDEERIVVARKLFWDPKNHQALCESCHNSHKQRMEKSGAVVGCDQSGRPADPNHHWNT
jgi:5-methylcytosine-specific restriction protein A